MNTTSIITIRKWILYSSQLLAIIFCVYLLKHAADYEISWIPLKWLFPGVVNNINNILSKIGTYIVIIPLTIIILSLLIPENIYLKILSSFFGISSTIMVLISGFYSKTFMAVYNMKLFLITKILTLEEKKAIFFAEFNKIQAEYKEKAAPFYNYLQDELNKNMSFYENHLETLKEFSAIPKYVTHVIQELDSKFNKELKIEEHIGEIQYIKYLTYACIGIIIVFTGTTIIRWLFEKDALKEGFTLAKTTAELAATNNENMTNTQLIVKEVVTTIKESISKGDIAIMITEKLTSAVEQAFNKVQARLNEFDKALTIISQSIVELQNKIKK